MSEEYPITTREMVGIGLKEIGRSLPILGAIVGSYDTVFAAIEINRIKQVLEELAARLKLVEEQTGKPCVLDKHSGEVLLYGCDQVRSDILAGTKSKAYGGVIAHFMTTAAEVSEVAEVLDCLRKLNADDLKILYKFVLGKEIAANRRVDEIIGYMPFVEPFEASNTLQEKMTAALPSFKRLESLGVLYLADANVGGVIHQIGPLSEYMHKFAFLTPSGIRLIRALPK